MALNLTRENWTPIQMGTYFFRLYGQKIGFYFSISRSLFRAKKSASERALCVYFGRERERIRAKVGPLLLLPVIAFFRLLYFGREKKERVNSSELGRFLWLCNERSFVLERLCQLAMSLALFRSVLSQNIHTTERSLISTK